MNMSMVMKDPALHSGDKNKDLERKDEQDRQT